LINQITPSRTINWWRRKFHTSTHDSV